MKSFRKYIRSAVVPLSIITLYYGNTATGFVSISSSATSKQHVAFGKSKNTPMIRPSVLCMASKTKSAPSMSTMNDIDVVSERLKLSRKQPHPTNEEQLRLLADAVEMRRLKQVETEQLAMKNKKSLPKLVISRAAGYGDDLEAYEKALEAGRKAREELVTRNMGLVYFIVKDIVGTPQRKKRSLQSLSADDLIQEGAIGLSRAVDRWNPEIGGRFSTYAVYWIRAAILRCIAERDDLVRVPVYVSSSVNKLAAATRELGLTSDMERITGGRTQQKNLSNDPSWQDAKDARELAEAAGLSESQLARALQVQRRRRRGGVLSFESWMQQGKDLSSDHSVGFEMSSSSTSTADLEYMKNELAKFLRPKEAEALSWRYGLTRDATTTTSEENMKNNQSGSLKQPKLATRGKWGEAMSFDEVGKRMHVSAEYGRRLCKKALSKLRLAYEQGRLEPSFLTQ